MSNEPEPPKPEETPPAPAPDPTPAPPPTPPTGQKSDKKLVAGLLGILLNGLGIHKFYLGYQKEGLIMLLVSVLTCGVGYTVMGVIGLVEGILYLTKTDEEFDEIYVKGQKPWF
jgi:TM2 domain-containing membrane protein YozV